MLHTISAAVLAGLLGSPHCLGMCGSFALACGDRAAHTLSWHAGKTTTYALLGAVAGALGASVPGPTWVGSVLSAGLLLWFSAALAGLTGEPALRLPGVVSLATRTAGADDLATRYLFGLVNGLLPCGLVYATLGIAVASGSALGGALTMVAFGLATVPGLTLFSGLVRRAMGEGVATRRAVAALIAVTGLWVIAQRHLSAGAPGHGPHTTMDARDSSPTLPPPPHIP